MKKDYVVKKESEIKKVFDNKKNVRSTFFSVWYIENDLDHFRYCLTIGKKYGGAVDRILMKRRLRDCILHIQDEINPNIDFIIVIYPASHTLDYQGIKENIIKLLKSKKLMR
jgi:ribonuclease P protein component